ncbi:MAG: hypothetical protein P8018_13170 [Acidobacteriota bacterium]
MKLKPGAVTANNALVITSVAAVIFLLTAGIAFVAIYPPQFFWGPRSAPRSYNDVRLADVIADLEKSEVLRPGTQWEDESLKNRRVTVSWFMPSDWGVVRILAREAGVEIAYPVGYHGDVQGPITIRRSPDGRGRITPYLTRKKGPPIWLPVQTLPG